MTFDLTQLTCVPSSQRSVSHLLTLGCFSLSVYAARVPCHSLFSLDILSLPECCQLQGERCSGAAAEKSLSVQRLARCDFNSLRLKENRTWCLSSCVDSLASSFLKLLNKKKEMRNDLR